MKRRLLAAIPIVWIAILTVLLVTGRAQEQTVNSVPTTSVSFGTAALLTTSSPSPTPIDQHWHVHYGLIEELENQLHTLNAQNTYVSSDTITISQDGKRFVIMLSDDAGCEDCEGH